MHFHIRTVTNATFLTTIEKGANGCLCKGIRMLPVLKIQGSGELE